MVKRGKRKLNRQKPAGTHRAITRIGTGVPVSKRNVPRDPPMLPHVLAYPIRTRFSLFMQNSTNQVGYSVTLAGTPTGVNQINHYFNPATGVISTSGGLTFNEIFIAAAMRVYGVDITADPGGANFVTTDFAIQKAVYYGPVDSGYDGEGIFLAVDFGNDIPGFAGRDSAARNRRAVVAATPPRLSWSKVVVNSQASCLNYSHGVRRAPTADNSGVNFPSGLIGTQSWPLGVIDVTVLVRRSVIAIANTFGTRAVETSFSSNADEQWLGETETTTVVPARTNDIRKFYGYHY